VPDDDSQIKTNHVVQGTINTVQYHWLVFLFIWIFFATQHCSC